MFFGDPPVPGTPTLSTSLTIRVRNESRAELVRIADRDGLTLGAAVNAAIAEYVKRHAKAVKRKGKSS
jgi:predicted transcriptional regulator